MDGNISYPLVVPSPQQSALVPASTAIEIHIDPVREEPDVRALMMFLWRRFCRLAVLFFLALALVRRLQRQVIQWRHQANYYRAQHQRAVQREAERPVQADARYA